MDELTISTVENSPFSLVDKFSNGTGFPSIPLATMTEVLLTGPKILYTSPVIFTSLPKGR